jgi:hypothetical protein
MNVGMQALRPRYPNSFSEPPGKKNLTRQLLETRENVGIHETQIGPEAGREASCKLIIVSNDKTNNLVIDEPGQGLLAAGSVGR